MQWMWYVQSYYYLHVSPPYLHQIVVVSRWYGGIKLGPDRFKHINNVARELLESEGFDERKAQASAKKQSKKGS
jgi:hypothetical protein